VFRVLRYFRGVEEIGPLLASKLLGLILLAFLSILLLSNVITALSSFFLARDLDLLVSSPVDWLHLYLGKLGETLLHSSWMVALMAVPIFAAYGVIYDGGWLFPFYVTLVFLPMLVVPGVIGSALTLTLVNVFPARRTRDLLSVIAIGAAGVLVLLFRLVRPEQLARPEGFTNLLDFITLLRTPTSPFLPSEWATGSIMGYLVGPFDGFPLVLLWSTAAASVVLGAVVHQKLYSRGFTRAQEGAERFVKGWIWRVIFDPVFKPLSVSKREFIIKDLKLFFRDTTQWSQLILLAVLVVIYLFNIRALPLFSGERVPFIMVTVISFLNLGLAGFVLASIAARFIFPSISLEGRQMWLLRSSPLDLKALLWSKYWIGTVPLLVLALAITVLTNLLLHVTPFMMAVGIGTIVLLTLAISAMALGFGALYPQFETENAAQIPTSYGGLVFMMSTIALLAAVIVIEAVPVSGYLRAAVSGEAVKVDIWMIGAFVTVAVICTLATTIPLKVGLRKMESFEF
jgi:ABC-2 type transport system permease protein